ncbi:MAG: hypothetical protein IT458_19860 [Planctomycetes bacterium]|nr:hypothetical protein [Planctomycetota bacterium]
MGFLAACCIFLAATVPQQRPWLADLPLPVAAPPEVDAVRVEPWPEAWR